MEPQPIPSTPAPNHARDALDAEAARREMSFDQFVSGLKMTWPRTRLGQAGVVVSASLLAYLTWKGQGEMAAFMLGVVLWMLGVEKSQRMTLSLMFGAVQQMTHRTVAATQTAAEQQGHALAQIKGQVADVQAGVNTIRADVGPIGPPPTPGVHDG